jgi:lysophospholipid acyltransferase (LPLAT)-like uncharacterized protein
MSLTRSQRLKALLIASAAYPLVAALGRTVRWRVEGAHHYDDLIRSGRPPILALWHGRILAATLYWRDRGIVALTSENFDGEWVARLMSRFGYRAARGSTSHGGARALVRLRRELAAGHAVAFTVDGPRGPARIPQPGAVWLAGATGHPLLPFHIEADRYWTMGSWDKGQVPKPFSTLSVAIAAPLFIESTTAAVVDRECQGLGDALGTVEARARRLLADHASPGRR